MTETELVENIISRLAQNVEIKQLKADAMTQGFSENEFNTALEKAHIATQQRSNKDPFIRLVLAPALFYIAWVCFYTDWAGRSLSIATGIGLACLLLGGRLAFSLIKQWRMSAKKSSV